MAKKVSIVLTCDLHEGDEVSAEQTVTFGFDGRTWEVDLCRAHLEEFEGFMVRLSGSARETGRQRAAAEVRSSGADGRGTTRRRAPAASDVLTKSEREACRTWARGNGFPNLGERGRVPTAAVEAWEAAGKPAA